ncbi:MAG TPA: polysaccharide deacetylase family protein [Bacillota bacterium]|nr:polysaccharide deacetylase family protein [Bacillota bacterium]
MRKVTYIGVVLLLLLFVATACGQKETAEPEDPSQADGVATNEEAEEDEVGEENSEEADDEEEEVEETEEEIEPTYTIDDIWQIVPIEDANEDVALITIDDAPDKYALEMAHTLKELDVPAIFFVNGHFIETDEKKEILKEIHELGFTIGNHTYSHADLQSLSEEEQYDEIVQVNDMVEEIIGERPKFFRAPFGQNTDYSKSVAEDESMVLMNWTYGYDWDAAYQTKESITDIMLHAPELRSGANLLMHDREWTNAALADIVTGLEEQGYELIDPKEIETIQ